MPLTNEVLTAESGEIDTPLLTEIATFYLTTFNNREFLASPSTGQRFQPCLLDQFGVEEGVHLPFETLCDLDLDHAKRQLGLDDLIVIRDFERTREVLRDRLDQQGCVSVMRDAAGEMQALTFGYRSDWQTIHTSEWGSDFPYSAETFADRDDVTRVQQRDEIRAMLEANGHDPSTLFCWNCLATHPDHRGLQTVLQMTRGLFQQVLSDQGRRTETILSDVYRTHTARRLVEAAGMTELAELEEDTLLMLGDLATVAHNMRTTPSEFSRLVRQRQARASTTSYSAPSSSRLAIV